MMVPHEGLQYRNRHGAGTHSYCHDHSGSLGFRMSCLPRAQMPQIEEADYPLLQQYCREHNVVLVTDIMVHPAMCKPKQCVHVGHGRIPRPGSLKRPVLLAADKLILDGNHRWEDFLIKGKLMNSWILGLEFDRAKLFLDAFPRVHYLDSHNRPVHHKETTHA